MAPQPPGQPTTTGSSGLDTRLASTLCYALTWVTGIVFLVIEKNDKEVRFHAWQSLALFGGLSIVDVVFSFIGPFMPGILHALISFVLFLVGLAIFILWILLLVQTYQGKKMVLPVVGPFAEAQVAKGS